MQFLFRYANPAQFMRLSAALLPFTSIAAVLLLVLGLYLGFTVPPDYQQGMTVTIMFIHVPAALVAEGVYGLIAVLSLMSLVWRHPLSDVMARAAAPLGALFTALGLVTAVPAVLAYNIGSTKLRELQRPEERAERLAAPHRVDDGRIVRGHAREPGTKLLAEDATALDHV